MTIEAQEGCGALLKDFKAKVENDEVIKAKVAQLRSEVQEFAVAFPMPGFDDV